MGKKSGFTRQIEYELGHLYPGKDVGKLVKEYYRKKISLCVLVLAAGIGLMILQLICSSLEPVLILLIPGSAAAVFIGQDMELHKQYELRNQQLLLEYPEFVSRLQLLLCSGMSIRSAFFKLGKEYQKHLQKGGTRQYVSEELLLAIRKMESGMGETEALEFFGRRCHLFCYKKLVSLIQQNLKRGTDGLRDALMNETKAAFEERKQAARRLGEEAGTKLLFPMMLMMGVVMVIIMIPAFISFGGLGL